MYLRLYRVALYAQHENIVRLPKLLSCCGDLCSGSRIAKHSLNAVEAKKLSFCILRFGNAVGHKKK